jgi:hypothetical protein
MTNVSVVPIALGMVGCLLIFAAWLPFAIRESRRPVHWRDLEPAPPAEMPVPTPRVAVLRVPVDDEPPRISHGRIAVVIAAFALWSLVTTRTTHRRV